MHDWHKHEVQGLDIRLKALKMIPFFFAELPSNATFVDIDISDMLDCLATLTSTAAFRTQEIGFDDQQMIWQEGAATRLLLFVVGSHVESISTKGRKPPPPTPMASSWCGISAAMGLYLQTILKLWNAGDPIEPRLHRRILLILRQDLERSRRRSLLLTDLWFWKAFVAAMSLDTQSASAADMILKEMKPAYKMLVMEWSIVTGVTEWEEAREALSRIVWPGVSHGEDSARELWYRCTS